MKRWLVASSVALPALLAAWALVWEPDRVVIRRHALSWRGPPCGWPC